MFHAKLCFNLFAHHHFPPLVSFFSPLTPAEGRSSLHVLLRLHLSFLMVLISALNTPSPSQWIIQMSSPQWQQSAPAGSMIGGKTFPFILMEEVGMESVRASIWGQTCRENVIICIIICHVTAVHRTRSSENVKVFTKPQDWNQIFYSKFTTMLFFSFTTKPHRRTMTSSSLECK